MALRSAWVKWPVLAVTALYFWPPARGFLFINEAINGTVARQVLMGARLYTEAADWKGPLGYLLYAAVLGPTHFSLVALHLFGLLLVGLLLLCAGLMARRLGESGALFPACALTLVFLAQTLGPSVEMDLPMAVLSAVAYLAMVVFLVSEANRPSRLLPALAGCLLALAISVKQVALLDFGALVVVCLCLTRVRPVAARARGALFPLGLGALVGAGLVALLVAHYSTFQDYLAWAWIIPWAGQRVTLAQRLFTWSDLAVRMVAPVALIWALGLAGGVLVWREHRGKNPPVESRAAAVPGVLLPLWLLAGVIGLLLGGQALAYHMTQAAVPLGVLAALGLSRCLRACPEGRWRSYVVAVVMIALLLGMAAPLRNSAWRWRDRVFGSPDAEESRVLGLSLAARTSPEDRIVVIAHNPAVAFWSGRRLGTRYLAVEHYWNPALEAHLPRYRRLLGPLADPARAFLEDVRRTQPRFILVPADPPWFVEEATPPRRAWLREVLQGYHLAATGPLYDEYERSKNAPSAPTAQGGHSLPAPPA